MQPDNNNPKPLRDHIAQFFGVAAGALFVLAIVAFSAAWLSGRHLNGYDFYDHWEDTLSVVSNLTVGAFCCGIISFIVAPKFRALFIPYACLFLELAFVYYWMEIIN